MNVDRLTFVVVDRMIAAVFTGPRLCRFIGLESQVELLFGRTQFDIVQTAITEHQVVMCGYILRIDRGRALEPVDCLRVLSLQKQDSSDLIKIDAIARILRFDHLKFAQRAVIVAVGFERETAEKMCASQVRL